MTAGELTCATATWWQAHFGAVMSGVTAVIPQQLRENQTQRKLLLGEWPCGGVQKYQLDGVKGAVCTTQKVTIPPFQTINIKANAGVKGHCMKVQVLMEPALGPQLPAAVVPIATNGELHPGSLRVPICLCNMSTCAMEIPAKTVVGQIIPTNQVQLVVHPTRTAKETSNKSTQRMGLGGFRSPGPKGVAWIRAEMG